MVRSIYHERRVIWKRRRRRRRHARNSHTVQTLKAFGDCVCGFICQKLRERECFRRSRRIETLCVSVCECLLATIISEPSESIPLSFFIYSHSLSLSLALSLSLSLTLVLSIWFVSYFQDYHHCLLSVLSCLDFL